jgi:sec-independent protein translocase protein TatA
MLGSLGFPEILMILLIVIILFGAAKLPQLGRGLGQGIKNFKNALNEGKDDEPKAAPKNTDHEDDHDAS